MPFSNCNAYVVRTCHGLFSFGILYALLYFKTDLQKALFKRDISYIGAFLGLFGISLFLYYTTSFMDPGFVRTSYQKIIYEDQSVDANFTALPLRFCGFCGKDQPLRGRHCEECHRCVHKFDHHCPWLDTCIGERNHRYFYLFLLSESVLTFWTVMIASRSLVFITDPMIWLRVNCVMLCLIIFVICCFTVSFVLAIMHTYVMMFNVTTWEFVSRRRITYLKDLHGEVNPFHQGILGNISRFLFSGRTYNWEQTYMRNASAAHYYGY